MNIQYACSFTVFIRLNAADGSKITKNCRPRINAALNQMRIMRKNTEQVGNLHHPDNYDSISAK